MQQYNFDISQKGTVLYQIVSHHINFISAFLTSNGNIFKNLIWQFSISHDAFSETDTIISKIVNGYVYDLAHAWPRMKK